MSASVLMLIIGQTIKYKGALHPPGQILVDPGDVDELLAAGCELADEDAVPPADNPPGGPAAETDELIAAIVAVIPNLDPDKDFTAAGLPNASALAKALEVDSVSAEQRDRAWEIHQANENAGND